MTPCQIYESICKPHQPATDSGEYHDLDQIIKPSVHGEYQTIFDENEGLATTVLSNRDPENYTELKQKEKSSPYQELVVNTNEQKLSEEESTHRDKVTIYEVVETRFENFISWFSP